MNVNNELHDAHVTAWGYDCQADYENGESKYMQMLEDRWIDNGCSNVWEDEQYWEQHPY